MTNIVSVMRGPAIEVAVFITPVGDELMARFSCAPFVLTGNLAAAEAGSEYLSETFSNILGHIVPKQQF